MMKNGEESSCEKDKIRSKTSNYFKKYCDLKKKCQICGELAEIHHPNYKDYLKINLLCRKHHTELHKSEIEQPPIIDLKSVPIKKQCKRQEDIIIKDIDTEKKKKAICILKYKGENLSKAVREMIANLAKEFDEKY